MDSKLKNLRKVMDSTTHKGNHFTEEHKNIIRMKLKEEEESIKYSNSPPRYLILGLSTISIFIVIILFSSSFMNGFESRSSDIHSITNQMEGIELQVILEKQEYSIGEDVVVKIKITNRNNAPYDIFVPTSNEIEGGIAGVMVERENQMLWQLLRPIKGDNSNITGRSYYGFDYLQLGSKETIEQEFIWRQDLIVQESQETIQAVGGEYIISTFIILDEIQNQTEYFEPNKQLVSKIKLSLK